MYGQKVSVLIPLYNARRTIVDTIQSVIDQNWPDYEIIVVDDFSEDNSYNIVKMLLANYRQLKLFKNPFKGGNRARSYAFSQCTGDFIQWLDADDVILKKKFETQVQFLQNNSEIDIVYSDWQMNHYDNNFAFTHSRFKISGNYEDYLYELICDNWTSLHNYLLTRKAANFLHHIEAWNPDTIVGQDHEYFLKAAINRIKFGYCPGNFSIYNLWGNQTVSSKLQFKSRLQFCLDKNYEYRMMIKNSNLSKKYKYISVMNAQILSSYYYNINLNLNYSFNPFLINIFKIHWKQRLLLPLLAILSIRGYVKAHYKKLLGYPYKVFDKFQKAINLLKTKHLAFIVKQFLKIDYQKYITDTERIEILLNWFEIGKNKKKNTTISYGYTLISGWLPPYPETNGYIINTYLSLWEYLNNNKFLQMATQIADWEVKVQHPNGGVRVGNVLSDAVDVFDTGAVLFGLIKIYEITGNEKYLKASIKAGNWLCHNQELDGRWIKHSFHNIPHAYHSIVARALLKLYSISPKSDYKDAAFKSIKWILSQQQENGWFNFQSFSLYESPYTHTMAYTIEGLLDFYFLLPDDEPIGKEIFCAIKKYCENLIFSLHLDKCKPEISLLPGKVNEKFRPAANYICLTGNVQFAVNFYKLFLVTNESKYQQAAENLISIVNRLHCPSGTTSPLNGLAGSYPIWGKYHPFEFPNWPVKYYIDALLERVKLKQHGILQ